MHGAVKVRSIVSIGGGSAGKLGDCVIWANMTTPRTPHAHGHVVVGMVAVVWGNKKHWLQVHGFPRAGYAGHI